MRASKIIEVETVTGALSGILGAVYMAYAHSISPLGWITYFLLFGSIALIVSNWVLQFFRPPEDNASHSKGDFEY